MLVPSIVLTDFAGSTVEVEDDQIITIVLPELVPEVFGEVHFQLASEHSHTNDLAPLEVILEQVVDFVALAAMLVSAAIPEFTVLVASSIDVVDDVKNDIVESLNTIWWHVAHFVSPLGASEAPDPGRQLRC